MQAVLLLTIKCEVCVCVPELNDIAPLLSICHLLISGVRRKTHVKCEQRVKEISHDIS